MCLVFLAGGWFANVEALDSTMSATPIGTRLEELQRIRAEKQAEMKATIQEQNQVRVTAWQEKREEFQNRLQALKDAAKQRAVAALDKAYTNINERWTNHFENVLDRLTKIADKLKLIAEDQENTEALTKIEAIYKQISDAQTSVDAQAAKEYIIDLTDETQIRENAMTVSAQLRADLQNLRTQIIDIRTAIKEVWLLLKPLGTPIPTPSE